MCVCHINLVGVLLAFTGNLKTANEIKSKRVYKRVNYNKINLLHKSRENEKMLTTYVPVVRTGFNHSKSNLEKNAVRII